MTAEDLATALTSRDITPIRLMKLARHLTSRQQLSEVLGYLRPDERELVLSGIEPFIRKLV